MNELRKKDVVELSKEVIETVNALNLEEKRTDLKLLESESLLDSFWDDSEKAQNIMSRISYLKEEITTAEELIDDSESLMEIFDFAKKESKSDEKETMIKEFLFIKEKLDKFSLRKFLSGKYDSLKAIITINAGQGGTESNDWVEMLYRMYTMYFDKEGWEYKTTEIAKGSETGMTGVTIHVNEPYAFGLLKKEHGAHRLVRISPYNAQGLRQTTFAGVEVLPQFEDVDEEIEIPEKDIEFKAVRSGGPGGQSVNKTSSAVQITHIPSGISVHSSNQKSQVQNRENAMKILRAKLWRIKEEKELKKIQDIKGEYKVAGWGNQIRNYILHPYKLVKDLRTEVESKDPKDVLDGNIGQFLEAQVRME
jgi:peptide chain release factor 2